MTVTVKGTFDANGIPTGWYPSDIYPDGVGIPDTAIDVAPNDYAEFVNNNGLRAMENGVVTIVVPASPAPIAPLVISRKQFFQQLAVMSLITQDEAIAALATGQLPDALKLTVAKLPADSQFAANMALVGDQSFFRNDNLVMQIATLYSWANADLDKFWLEASSL